MNSIFLYERDGFGVLFEVGIQSDSHLCPSAIQDCNGRSATIYCWMNIDNFPCFSIFLTNIISPPQLFGDRIREPPKIISWSWGCQHQLRYIAPMTNAGLIYSQPEFLIKGSPNYPRYCIEAYSFLSIFFGQGPRDPVIWCFIWNWFLGSFICKMRT